MFILKNGSKGSNSDFIGIRSNARDKSTFWLFILKRVDYPRQRVAVVTILS